MSNSIIDIFFEKYDFKIPLMFPSDDFKYEVNRFLTSYIVGLKNCGANILLVDKLLRFRKSCSYVLSNYFRGIHYNAYENFEKALKSLGIDDSPLLYSTLSDNSIFRGRINNGISDYTADQMFHIPLNLRRIINTQRYSFPGLPCLYAGASVYSCWVELNRPSFDTLQLAVLNPTNYAKNMKVVDLSHIPEQIEELRNNEWFDENEYLLYWPLVALCSIKVRHEDQSFKPEYIFPQFYLQYILRKNNANSILGIKYISIKAATVSSKQLSENWTTYVNYVFPVHSDETKGDKCDYLSKCFEIGHNRSGTELHMLSETVRHESSKIKVFNKSMPPMKIDRRKLYTKDGIAYPYNISSCGLIEQALLKDSFEESGNLEMFLQPV